MLALAALQRDEFPGWIYTSNQKLDRGENYIRNVDKVPKIISVGSFFVMELSNFNLEEDTQNNGLNQDSNHVDI